MPKTHYDTLGLSRKASATEIKKAFRTLAKKYHPDLNPSPSARDRFIAVEQAYEILSSPASKRRYDRLLNRPKKKAKTNDKTAYQTARSRYEERNAKRQGRRYSHMNYEEFTRHQKMKAKRKERIDRYFRQIIVLGFIGILIITVFLGTNENEALTYLTAFPFLIYLGVLAFASEPIKEWIAKTMVDDDGD